MPSKKKKARGKARRAAKSREAKDDDGAVNEIDSKMQRLQISNNKNSQEDGDEDALLEEAINLAAAEKEEPEAAAKNDQVNNSEICNHGFVPFPRIHVCRAFLESLGNDYWAGRKSRLNLYHILEHFYEATKTKYAEVWNDPNKMNWVVSYFVRLGTKTILDDSVTNETAARSAMFSSFFEQWAAVVVHAKEARASCDWDIFRVLCHWTKILELYKGDEHTLVSFFRKRITCKCLDDKYKEVRSITKIGYCCYEDCSLPGNKTIRSKMLYCTQCRRANYCSRECQVAHWLSHRDECKLNARWIAAKKSRRKKSMNSVQG